MALAQMDLHMHTHTHTHTHKKILYTDLTLFPKIAQNGSQIYV